MSYGYWLGFLGNFSLGFQGWAFLLVLSAIAISAISYGIHFFLTGRNQTIIMLASFALALFLFGILGLVYYGLIYLISFALFSDFRRDYH